MILATVNCLHFMSYIQINEQITSFLWLAGWPNCLLSLDDGIKTIFPFTCNVTSPGHWSKMIQTILAFIISWQWYIKLTTIRGGLLLLILMQRQSERFNNNFTTLKFYPIIVKTYSIMVFEVEFSKSFNFTGINNINIKDVFHKFD